jgi:hypothetical protein
MRDEAKKRKAIRLGVEVLESRNLLSGDVTASVVNGDLIITGDALDNQLRIDQLGLAAGEFRITGERFTNVNGDSAPLAVSGVTRDVFIALGGQRDKLVLDGGVVPRDLRISTAAAKDVVLINQTKIGGDLKVITGAGNDSVHLVGLEVQGRTSVVTGAGDDVVTRENSLFHGDSSISTAGGNDTILTRESTFEQRSIVRAGSGKNLISKKAISRSFDFRAGALGWKAGFADYDPAVHVIDAESGIRELPPELGAGTGFYLAGTNASDDLFMFLKRRLSVADGIKPNRLYQVRLTIVFGSNAPSGSAGIGGSPGESVFLKAGASPQQPKAILAEDGHLRMNVDKGNQATGGPAASVVGTIGNGSSGDAGEPAYVSLQRHHIHEFTVRSDAQGNLWLLVGTDSGFEGRTALFFQRIEATLIPLSGGDR